MPPKVPRRPKLLRSNPHHVLTYLINEQDDDVDDWEMMPVYRRRHEFNDLRDELDNMELSDEIKFRLMLSRVKALQKHKEIYYNNVA